MLLKLDKIAEGICRDKGYGYLGYIDEGAFKETYRISDGRLSYALKIYKSDKIGERDTREIQVLQRMNCSNIGKLVGASTCVYGESEYHYLIEEYLGGGSLLQRIEANLLDREAVLALGNDLINALESMYESRIVHRDIKPKNIMFRESRPDAVLVDFGLVRDLDGASLTQTFLAMGPGTPLYSAPEQLNNEKEMIDWRTDQFALGITLCETLLGKHPFDAKHNQKIVEKIRSYAQCNNEITDELLEQGFRSIVKMIEPYPINRFRTPSQLADAWRRSGE